jgi:hypothetical protein
VDVWGGWKDAGGDNGKYLSHLSYANFFNPQQAALVVWALGASYASAPALFDKQGLTARVIEGGVLGRRLSAPVADQQGYFYMTLFDRWAEPGAERMVTAYVGIDGVYTKDYQAAFPRGGRRGDRRARARASTLTHPGGVHGEFSAQQYLQDAERAFAHLQQHNREILRQRRREHHRRLHGVARCHRAVSSDAQRCLIYRPRDCAPNISTRGSRRTAGS